MVEQSSTVMSTLHVHSCCTVHITITRFCSGAGLHDCNLNKRSSSGLNGNATWQHHSATWSQLLLELLVLAESANAIGAAALHRSLLLHQASS